MSARPRQAAEARRPAPPSPAVALLPAVVLLLAVACAGEPAGDRAGPGLEPVLAAARAAADAGRWDEAERALGDYARQHPGEEQAWVALGQLYAAFGRLQQAADVYVRLADLRPENGLYALRAGSYLESVRRSDAAGPYLETAARVRVGDADAAYRWGLHLLYEGRDDEAAAALARAVALAPDRPDVTLKLAQALVRLGRFEEATRALDAALARRPDEPLVTFQRGLARQRAGDAEGAVSDFQRVLQLDAGQYRAEYALARALLAAGRVEEGRAAMARFAAGEEERRSRETARLVRGLARAGAQDDPLEHRRRLQDLVLADPGNAEAHRLLAEAYVEEGDYQQAAEAFDRAARLDPADHESGGRRDEMRRRLGAGRGGETP